MSLKLARDWVWAASSVAVLTGAGISAESGVPTFRGADSSWRQYKPEELATAEAFSRDPKFVWEWYEWRRALIAQANPNPGHYALVELENAKPQFTLIIQNVDGLHSRAGSNRVLELHGDIWKLRCIECRLEWPDHRVPLPELPPHCACGGVARPGVVWFGESLPCGTLIEAQRAAASAELLLVIGTSAIVYPAAGLLPLAKSAGARVIEVNPEKTLVSDQLDISLPGRSGELLPLILT